MRMHANKKALGVTKGLSYVGGLLGLVLPEQDFRFRRITAK